MNIDLTPERIAHDPAFKRLAEIKNEHRRQLCFQCGEYECCEESCFTPYPCFTVRMVTDYEAALRRVRELEAEVKRAHALGNVTYAADNAVIGDLRAENQRLREALGFYSRGDLYFRLPRGSHLPDSGVIPILLDCGRHATKALKGANDDHEAE